MQKQPARKSHAAIPPSTGGNEGADCASVVTTGPSWLSSLSSV